MHELMDSFSQNPNILVIGVGESGCNAVQKMVGVIEGVNFVCCYSNGDGVVTDKHSEAIRFVQLDIDSSICQTQRFLDNVDLVFIVAKIDDIKSVQLLLFILEIANQNGILTMAVVTAKPLIFNKKPFKLFFNSVDSYIGFSNSGLINTSERQGLLSHIIQSISDLIMFHGLIRIDFADIRSVLHRSGFTIMERGLANGKNRAVIAMNQALKSLLFSNINLVSAKGIIINITAGLDLEIGEIDDIGSLVTEKANDEATVVVGTVIDAELSDGELQVTIIATGFDDEKTKINLEVGESIIPTFLQLEKQV